MNMIAVYVCLWAQHLSSQVGWSAVHVVRGLSHPSPSRYRLLPEHWRRSCTRADDARRPLAGHGTALAERSDRMCGPRVWSPRIDTERRRVGRRDGGGSWSIQEGMRAWQQVWLVWSRSIEHSRHAVPLFAGERCYDLGICRRDLRTPRHHKHII